jgi:glycerophosphoryl diester phosphodiesterase
MVVEPFRIIAHRGASAYAPENTMAAFRKAVEMGAPEVETDVGFTKDHRLILFHDRSLERTTNGTGLPSDYTLEELKILDAGSWMAPKAYPDFRWDEDFSGEPLITLDELFEAFGRSLLYHVEIKDLVAGLVPAVVQCVQRYGLAEHVILSIIDAEEFLLESKRLDPRIRTELAPNRQLKAMGVGAIEAVARAGHDIAVLSGFNQTKELVDAAHALGLEVRSSGIKNHQQMVEAVQIGCNGMTINWPDWLINYVNKESSQGASGP